MPKLITIDMETYYDPDYSLTKLSTEEYVNDPRFEVIGFAYKIDNEPAVWVPGNDPKRVRDTLRSLPWDAAFVLAHNTMFDGAIMSWKYGIRPKGWLDTLSMGRALHGVEAGGSLKAMAERYTAGAKGTEVLDAKGKRSHQFSSTELAQYGAYCKNDVELTHNIFHKMMAAGFPPIELKLIDLTLKMYVEPVLRLDSRALELHLEDTAAQKQGHLVNALSAIGRKDLALQQILGDEETRAGIRKELMSNPKFAAILEALVDGEGKRVVPSIPMKISMTTGKETYAFAKSDEPFKALLQHEDVRVQALCAARLGTKSTLEETRTQRFINIGQRNGVFPVPLKYYAAHTGRWGGSDSVNLQNLPSRGPNAGKLKKAILAPEGYVFIDADSSQIEARTLAWESEQDDLVESFARGEDVYKIMAAAIYGKAEEEITKEERFVGKTTILGAGYGMGGPKFQAQLKTFGSEMSTDECARIISVYRSRYSKIPQLWRESQDALRCMVRGQTMKLGRNGLLTVDDKGILLPNGLYIFYNGIREVADNEGKRQFVYTTRTGPNKIYGGKVVENFTQAVARCIIGEQMLKIAKRYKVVLTVHDAIGIVARREEADEARAYVETCMRWVPAWAEGLPVNCESGMGDSYGDC
jgi:DNA polymerase I-like protein with 3'-5' exonuclease and polymerase domains